MSKDPTSVSKEVLGSLTSCLMEGNADEERGARKARRRALIVSIVVQILVLATLVMYPLLSHGERLAYTVTPYVPYSYPGGPAHPTGDPAPPWKTPSTCRICVSPFQRPNIAPGGPERTTSGPGDPTGPFVPGLPDGHYNPGAPLVMGPGRSPEPPREPQVPAQKPRISLGHIEAASLVHRVEPVYPPLPLQMHREGRVELHAIIATDGSIQALEVVSGDPLFYASALAAVREWRYRPTFLDGQAVEVDTQISVIYTLNR